MNWALPWNNGVTVIHASSAVSRTNDTHSSAKKYIWACGMATPLDGPVVPEVKNTDARSCGYTSGSSTSLPAGRSASSSSHGAASHPASRSTLIALSCSPVSMIQNLVMSLAASCTATNRSAYTSSITANLASTVRTWWARKSCSYAVLIGTSTSPETAVPTHVRTNREEFAATMT